MRYLSFVFVFAFYGTIIAQDTLKKIRVSEAQIFVGTDLYPVEHLSTIQFQSFALSSEILQQDFSGFSQENYNSVYTDPTASLLLGFQFKNHKNLSLRTGINYRTRTNFIGQRSKIEYYPYDTLTSSQTGQEYYLDSSVSKHLFMSHSAEQLQVDVSLIYSTDSRSRWSLKGGIGLLSGFGFNAYTDITYGEYSSTSSYGNNSTQGFSNSERIKNANYFTGSIYFPVLVDFRIGKNNIFWQKMHLFYEFRPSFCVSYIPEFAFQTHMNLSYGLGVRIVW